MFLLNKYISFFISTSDLRRRINWYLVIKRNTIYANMKYEI